MGVIFYEGRPNFPADQSELDRRLAEIEKLINNKDGVSYVNIKFCEAAFQLMQDCEMLTEKNLRFLCNAVSCRNFNKSFRFPFNPFEGVLRAVKDDNDVYADGYPRFYPGTDRRIEMLNGQRYLISNDWYKDGTACPNKRAFYELLKASAQAICETYWSASIEEPVTEEKISAQADDVKKILAALEALHKKVDALTAQIETLNKNIEPLKNILKLK